MKTESETTRFLINQKNTTQINYLIREEKRESDFGERVRGKCYGGFFATSGKTQGERDGKKRGEESEIALMSCC